MTCLLNQCLRHLVQLHTGDKGQTKPAALIELRLPISAQGIGALMAPRMSRFIHFFSVSVHSGKISRDMTVPR